MFSFRRRPKYEPTQFNTGLWRIWDHGAVIGWLSTDDCVRGWVEVDFAFQVATHHGRRGISRGTELWFR